MSNRLIEESTQLLKERYGRSRPGLDNAGNSSYVNASIQGLFACEEFRIAVILQGMDYPNLYYHKYLADLFIDLAIGNYEFYSATELRDIVAVHNPSFHTDSEHNPLDFILILLDLIFKSSEVNASDLVTNAISGLYTVNMRCVNNHHWSSLEHFYIASLYVPTTPPSIKLSKLIKFMDNFETEVNVSCLKCGSKEVTAKNTFNYTSDHLVLHLQRVEVIEANRQPSVIVENTIRVLDEQYTLVACICYDQTNDGIQSYSCHAKIGETWYMFRDRYVSVTASTGMPEQKSLENAYILFYSKASIADNYDEIDGELKAMRARLPPPSARPPSPAPPPPIPPSAPPKPVPVGHSSHYAYKPSPNDYNMIDFTLGSGVGLRNLGNTCYMNATLQALFHCEEFRLHILIGQHFGTFHNLLKQLFLEILSTEESVLEPEEFRRTFVTAFPDFVCGQQHDAREFLGFLIESLFTEVNTVTPDEPDIEPTTSEQAWQHFLDYTKNSYLVHIFSIQNEFRNICLSCKHQWSTFGHPWLCLLVLPDNIGEQEIDVQTCINNATHPEKVKMTCRGCKQLKNVNRFTLISRPPRILVLQMNIYVYHPKTYRPMKLNLNLIINEFIVVSNEKYVCIACVLHYGNKATSGHYTAYCKRGNNWYYFNDEAVNHESTGKMPEQTKIKYSYLLFYERLSAKKDLKVPALDFSGIPVPRDRLRSGSRSGSVRYSTSSQQSTSEPPPRQRRPRSRFSQN